MKDYETYEAIYDDYAVELRALAPELQAWKQQLITTRGEAQQARIWWTGISGHPRVLGVFRKYYFAIEQLNVNRDAAYSWLEPPEQAKMWGEEDQEPGPRTRRHIDLLIAAVRDESPELAEIVDGLVLVPVGLDDEDFPV